MLQILVADDDPVFRRLLEAGLAGDERQVTSVSDGVNACLALERADGPDLAIVDWMMPGLDGPSVCRRVRGSGRVKPLYLILLTSKGQSQDLIEGLGAGADDYVTKPFDLGELRARVAVGGRMIQLQRALADRVAELESAMAQVKQLHGLLPICSYCKRIRDDEDYWERVELYIGKHTDAKFSHSVCPDCFEQFVKPKIDELAKRDPAPEGSQGSPQRRA